MKLMITISVGIFSTLGGWLGSSMSHGNPFGGWSILLTGIGGFIGVWIGYKIGKNYL